MVKALLATRSRRTDRFIRTAPFFRALPGKVKAILPLALRDVNHRARSSQAQWWYDDPRLHIEAWWHAKTGRLELGLHLEGPPALNERIAAGLSRQMLMINARLGGRLDLEPWDKGWIRLYETYPVDVFDSALVASMAGRIAELTQVLWPMCRDLRGVKSA
ncbi:MAG: hypothetical protein E6I88_02765 [Chloroflexi bacterium]|nr:MAG: hypothetical protein E6I88_02765 [Chloroflexota bacterium]